MVMKLMLSGKAWGIVTACHVFAVGVLVTTPLAVHAAKGAGNAVAADDAKDKKKDNEADSTKLKGTWKVVSTMADGVEQTEEHKFKVSFDGEAFTVQIEGVDHLKGTLSLDASADPKTIDLSFTEGPHKGDRMLGIYKWDGEKLNWCTTMPKGKTRPTEFTTTSGSGHRLFVLEKGE
jgi:uncharacterized protein (TIGR03067 family)